MSLELCSCSLRLPCRPGLCLCVWLAAHAVPAWLTSRHVLGAAQPMALMGYALKTLIQRQPGGYIASMFVWWRSQGSLGTACAPVEPNVELAAATCSYNMWHRVTHVGRRDCPFTCWAVADADVIVAVADSTAAVAALLLDRSCIVLVSRNCWLLVVSVTPRASRAGAGSTGQRARPVMLVGV